MFKISWLNVMQDGHVPMFYIVMAKKLENSMLDVQLSFLYTVGNVLS